MTNVSSQFPLMNSVDSVLDDPTAEPATPGLDSGSSAEDRKFGKAKIYDSGVNPHVAVNAGDVVVEVHQSQNDTTLWYHIGRVDGDTIKWGKSHQYDDGANPSVAINDDGLIVEVHQSQNDPTLWYRLGRADGDTIKWGKSHQYDNGVNPSVAINDDGLVVEVHQSQNATTLWYRLGRVDGDTVKWDESHQYDDGINPSVAVTNDGIVAEIHRSQNETTLWFRGTGKAEKDKITWRDNESQQFGIGEQPALACNMHLALEVHTSANNLLYSVVPLSGFHFDWIDLHGNNSYAYCACSRPAGHGQKHESSHALKVKDGAPYLYAVLAKNFNTLDFPTGAVMKLKGPDGTTYDHAAHDDNHLVVMSGSSVRYLVVKNPKAGDWTMMMNVPQGVEFHCECNTVPSKDSYNTIHSVAKLHKRLLGIDDILFWGVTVLVVAVAIPKILKSGLTVGMYAGLKPETAEWISEFMWSKTAPHPDPKAIERWNAFLSHFANVLNGLADRLKDSGWKVFESVPAYTEWFGKNFSKEEYDVVIKHKLPLDHILFVYGLVYFSIRHMRNEEEQNAVRHALWQCYLKKAFGEKLATEIGDAHEKARPGTPADNKADEINNKKGQQLADRVAAPYDCFAAARKMWDDKELQERPDLEGDPN